MTVGQPYIGLLAPSSHQCSFSQGWPCFSLPDSIVVSDPLRQDLVRVTYGAQNRRLDHGGSSAIGLIAHHGAWTASMVLRIGSGKNHCLARPGRKDEKRADSRMAVRDRSPSRNISLLTCYCLCLIEVKLLSFSSFFAALVYNPASINVLLLSLFSFHALS